MCQKPFEYACGTASHLNRRTLLKMGAVSSMSWLTPLGTTLARQDEQQPSGSPAKSVIVLWLAGGPSQLETFDPHPGTRIAAGSKAIRTRQRDLMIGDGLPLLAEHMDSISIVRSVTSREGDHERAVYNAKTGFRPDPTLVHPSLGAIMCHELGPMEGKQVDIPHHISILPGQWPARGGYLGDKFDAFKVNDPALPVPDVRKQVSDERFQKRLNDLQLILETEFAKGRHSRFAPENNLDRELTDAALRMMSSDQLKAFDVSTAPESQRAAYGDTPFGRACLTAVRLIEVGVRCVEVTLSGWDSHVNNHEIQGGLISQLDPAFASLMKDLKDSDLLDSTVVVCGGEFGRTPTVNPAGGRDHWPHGFSIALAGGGIQGGRVIGETSPTPFEDSERQGTDLVDPQPIENIHATILETLGVNFFKQLDTPVGRPMTISEGKIIKPLLEV